MCKGSERINVVEAIVGGRHQRGEVSLGREEALVVGTVVRSGNCKRIATKKKSKKREEVSSSVNSASKEDQDEDLVLCVDSSIEHGFLILLPLFTPLPARS